MHMLLKAIFVYGDFAKTTKWMTANFTYEASTVWLLSTVKLRKSEGLDPNIDKISFYLPDK